MTDTHRLTCSTILASLKVFAIRHTVPGLPGIRVADGRPQDFSVSLSRQPTPQDEMNLMIASLVLRFPWKSLTSTA